MFTATPIDGPLELLALCDTAAGSRVEVAPGRGGMVTRFAIGARDLLSMDDGTLRDPGKNVRGGIPVLFPIAGKLPADTYRVGERSFTLKQHGFARNLPWAVTDTDTRVDARVTLALTDTPGTRAVFPYGFSLRVTYALAGPALTVDTEVTASGTEPLPVHLGFHPYFRVAQSAKAGATVTTDAHTVWNNLTQRKEPFAGFDLTAPEVDLHLLDNRLRRPRLIPGEGPSVGLDLDTGYPSLVVWTLAGRDFVCVEPWTAPAGALATGEGLVTLPPGESFAARWTITGE